MSQHSKSEDVLKAQDTLKAPGSGSFYRNFKNYFYLLNLLTKKDIKVRYRGSVLGRVWTYIKPLIQFFIYFGFVGFVMGGNDRIYEYGIYLFAGFTIVAFFGEIFTACTTAITSNAPLIKKVFLPRKLFIFVAWRVALSHFIPQFLILFSATVLWGVIFGNYYFFHFGHLLAFLGGVLLVSLFGTGLGMMFATLNVFYRDAKNFVQIITMISTWGTPVLYDYHRLSTTIPHTLYNIYMCNPLAAAVELFHYAFIYDPSFKGDRWVQPIHWIYASQAPLYTIIAFALTIILFIIGNRVFSRFEGRFAQEL